MVRLQKGVDSAVESLGFPCDDRFHPHVTLARVKGATDKAKLNALLAADARTPFGSFEVSEFQLMESRLQPKGPTYSSVASFALA